MFVLACKDSTGNVKIEDIVAGEFNPSQSELTLRGYVCGEQYERVDPLVWVDVNNVNAGVAMILPLGVSESVASAALSAAWREWREAFSEEEELRKKLAEIERARDFPPLIL